MLSTITSSASLMEAIAALGLMAPATIATGIGATATKLASTNVSVKILFILIFNLNIYKCHQKNVKRTKLRTRLAIRSTTLKCASATTVMLIVSMMVVIAVGKVEEMGYACIATRRHASAIKPILCDVKV